MLCGFIRYGWIKPLSWFTLLGMESLPIITEPASTWSPRLPRWVVARGQDLTDSDVAFSAGIALKSLDDLIRLSPPWLDCWRDRHALKSAAVAAKMLGRSEEEDALRDAVLLTSAGDDPGPAGRLFLATRKLARRSGAINTSFVKQIADLLALRWDDGLAAIPDLTDTAIQSGRAAPFAVADLISAISAVRPDAEVLGLVLGEAVLAHKLSWLKPVPLLLPERYGPAFRSIGGRGRVHPGEPAYQKAICLAVVSGADTALRSAAEVDRRAARLLTVAPKLRTKGAEPVIRRLLTEDSVSISALGGNLSRWAATRLFERLESFEAVRELSGRSSFRIYGL
ncbi:hypothetical protein AGTUEHA105_LOCUS5159 [Agrobacterium tumefaciens]|uniref:Orf_Bo093 n=2 Tax=Rhizobium/Agrobacterium group TaxID=227290 RepID=A5WY13_AGRTU|nr:orf_Bo093 [Agrobacterium tumefaciens]UVY99375.1 hypothetical protein K4M20_00102 [Agrobacterium fabrum]CAD0217230.1 hypothetical protein AGTUEHA105_LOCUS5159 [Agrobacterium tumefaciens]